MSYLNIPPQKLPYKQKTKKWRKSMVDWADSKSYFNDETVRNSVAHKQINYDLVNGKLHMRDIELILDPEVLGSQFRPEKIQHYPILNSPLNVLRGEELSRVFDMRVIVTNPTAISQMEEDKTQEVYQRLQEIIADQQMSDEETNKRLEEINEYYTYKYQDIREKRANQLLNHYSKEQNFKLLFNDGFMDAATVGEEIYQCDIIGGEPIMKRVNCLKIRAYQSGYSNRLEDADIIVLEDYWSPGQIYDAYYDVLTEKDRKHIEEAATKAISGYTDEMGNFDETKGFVTEEGIATGDFFDTITEGSVLTPYDTAGNIRVLQVYWKSRRKIKKVKSYNPTTGQAEYNIYSEDYVTNTDMGEEEEIYYINEAWEGTKIGEDIYVNMRPRPVQYNTMSNPSRCHFGIVGTIYNLNQSKPYSLVDMMKEDNYMYDIIRDRLNRLMARNVGKAIRLDLAKVPQGWKMDKWLYYFKTNGLYIENSFNEGNQGAATGKLAGAMNNANNGSVDFELGNSIQSYVGMLEFIKSEMKELVGISRQREGQISNRETVGGVERATLQSSHITEWIFERHDDTKRRALECFLETAKIALRGRSLKFNYILDDGTSSLVELDGDQFAECDYGICVDNSQNTQKFNQQLETLAQAALQNHVLNFSTVTKLYSSCSMAEKQRMIEKNEQQMIEMQQQQAQQQQQAEMQKAQVEMQMKQAELQQQLDINMRDNETKILIAQINAQAKLQSQIDDMSDVNPADKEKFLESVRQFNEKMKLETRKVEDAEDKTKQELKLKEKQLEIQKQKTNSNK